MRTVGLKSLKNKLSEYVRLAAAGETIIITDRDRPVAEIGPPRSSVTPFEERGVREGWLKPARIRDGTPPPRRPMVPFASSCASSTTTARIVDLSRRLGSAGTFAGRGTRAARHLLGGAARVESI